MNQPDYKIKLTRKERIFIQREQDILEAALRSFHSDQWESVTVAQIAQQVGIAKGTMYLHFSSKHEIYARLALNFYQSLLSHLKEPLTGNAINKFCQLTGRAFEFHLQRPVYRRVTQFCEREDFKSSLSCGISDDFDKIDKESERLISTILTQGIDEGVFKHVAPDDLLLGLRCTFQGALTRFWCNANNEQSEPEKFINSVTSYMLGTIVSQPGLLADTPLTLKKSTKQPYLATQGLELNS